MEAPETIKPISINRKVLLDAQNSKIASKSVSIAGNVQDSDGTGHSIANSGSVSSGQSGMVSSGHFPVLPGSGFMRKDQTAFSPNHADGKSFMEHLRYPVSSHGEDLVSRGFHHFSSKPWDRKAMSHDQLLSNLRDGAPYSRKSRHGFPTNMINDQRYLENADINPIEFLASQFPGFAAENLADVYFANGGDLKLTVEMFNQLELQVDGGLSKNENSKVFSAPKFSAMDFPALSTSDGTLPKFSGDKINIIRRHRMMSDVTA